MDKYKIIVILIIWIQFNIIVSIQFPKKTICNYNDIYIRKDLSFDCNTTKCREYNMTYVYYITVWETVWKNCSRENEKYIKMDEEEDFIKNINDTECYYNVMFPCYSYSHSNEWIIVVIVMIIGNIFTVVCCLLILLINNEIIFNNFNLSIYKSQS